MTANLRRQRSQFRDAVTKDNDWFVANIYRESDEKFPEIRVVSLSKLPNGKGQGNENNNHNWKD
jgi:hypothetical protein